MIELRRLDTQSVLRDAPEAVRPAPVGVLLPRAAPEALACAGPSAATILGRFTPTL